MKTGLILFFGLYLFKLLQTRAKIKRDYNHAKQELYNNVEIVLGSEKLQNLKENYIWVNMPECLIYYVYDLPYDIEKRSTAGAIYKTWYYRPIRNARKNAARKYKVEIYTKNNFITDWSKIS